MRAMGVDPTKKLVTPRVVASVVMMFFLSIISDLVGLTGGFVISYLLLGLDAEPVLDHCLPGAALRRRFHGAV